MRYEIVYKAFAERDIWEIADYLSDYSMSAAEKFLREVKEKIENLADMPLIYQKIDPHREYRKMVVGNYVVIYVALEQTEKVLILRVVHGKRNYQEEL